MLDQLQQFLSTPILLPDAATAAAPDAPTAALEYRLQRLVQQAAEQRQPYEPVKLASLPAYAEIKQLDSASRIRLVELLVGRLKELIGRPYSATTGTARATYHTLLALLLRGRLDFTADDLQRLLGSYGEFAANLNEWQRSAFQFPVLLTLTHVQKLAATQPLPPGLRGALVELQTRARTQDSAYFPADAAKARARISEILHENGPEASPALTFSAADGFGRLLGHFASLLAADAPAGAAAWEQLLRQWRRAEGSKPTAKFLKDARQHIAHIGPDTFRRQALQWLGALQQLDRAEERHNYAYQHEESYYLDEANQTVAKGLIWTLQLFADDPLVLQQLADYAAKCYRKVPGVGPLCNLLGNACAYGLAQAGLPGVAHLSRLRVKEKNRIVQKVLDKQLREVATRLGLTPADLEDLAIPGFGLQQGRADYRFDGYRAELHVLPGATAELRWFRADDAPLKAEPAALKKIQPEAVKALKQTYTQVQQTLAAQRDRLEGSYLLDRRWSYPHFLSCYLHHPLMQTLARPLIWHLVLPDGRRANALWLDGAWTDAQGQPQPELEAARSARLWHPALAPAAEVLAWRELLEHRQLRQPFKQAFREVYLLTVAEERTATYSNRMAAHILRQFQFGALARQRGWDYNPFDNEGAALALPAWELQAEFWLTSVVGDDLHGGGQYIATDQVRFTQRHQAEALPLTSIPPLVFSEVMRDVDLFVGVASVGNDPLWRDNGGLPQYHDYWHRYSFGELSEVAKTRKAVLQRLVPRLKIAQVAEVQDKFLVVRGQLHTYKIHLGSGNILMSPNDQYLCIVPDGSRRAAGPNDVFLPFEGDAVLSIILSKALLLAEDARITDPTITRQIR